ncbi:MAG TPA: GNAT family N-acetyltransferase [Patescibacteria group bacterium]|nr:GNAT family N-acetyltransferase [Patescibacteria group bacterium]
MNFIIQTIDPSFAERCIKIQKNDGFKHAYYLTKERIHKLFSNGEQFYGAFTDKQELTGFVSINIDVVRQRIHFFVVDKHYQGKGVGSALLKHVISVARKEKVKNIYTYTEIQSPLERFLLRKGFEKAGYFRKRFGGKDANILSLYLPAFTREHVLTL